MTKKPKVLLLGDSIRMGYQNKVLENLSGEMDVIFPKENGQDTSTTLWQANQIFNQHGNFDVIHWNNGYWDMNIEPPMEEPFHPINEYRYMLNRMAQFFSMHTKELIFATTLPIKNGGTSLDNSGTNSKITYNNKWVTEYNQAGLEVMNKNHVFVNDLYAICLQDEYYFKGPDCLHLTDEGYCLLGDHVSTVIKGKVSVLR